MTATEQDGGACAGDLVDDGAKIRGVGSITFFEDNLKPLGCQIGLDALDHAGRKLIAFVDQGNLGSRIQTLQHVDRAGHIQTAGRVQLEQAGVAGLVSVIIRGASGDHHFAVLFGHDGGCRSQTRRIGGDQEVGFVFGNEAGV